jgi:hypothetical protein
MIGLPAYRPEAADLDASVLLERQERINIRLVGDRRGRVLAKSTCQLDQVIRSA